jgi:type IV pilus assembly protein PilB
VWRYDVKHRFRWKATTVTSNDDYVLEILLENNFVSTDEVEAARSTIVHDNMSVVDSLIQHEVLEQQQVLGILAEHFGMDLIDLVDFKLEPALRDMIPPAVARRYGVVPIHADEDGTVHVAIGDPFDMDTVDALRHVLKFNVEPVVALREEIKIVLDHYYAGEELMEEMVANMDDGAVDVSVGGVDDMIQESETGDADAPIIRLVSHIIVEAFRRRASDIHLEPLERRFRVRYRIDGVLHEVDSPPKRLQAAIISRVKIMAAMKISEKRVPQDGRIEVHVSGRQLDLRVSTVPSNHGEAVVMRILDKQNLALGLPSLGFLSDDQQTFEQLMGLADGIILVTGPTGSGKTTTLYACLNHINRPDRKIITVEDPVEYQLSGINQVHVRHDIGLSFEVALRSILRQAPNIVMIGEIRDLQTANIATEASLTGHLVFSTLHTNDAPSAVTRLLDIGVKPFLVASSLRAIMAQRLVRCVCEHCKEPYEPTEQDLRILGSAADQVAAMELVKGRGCDQCSLSGYHSRKGIFEIVVINDELQRMIYDLAPYTEFRDRAREFGMRTLREDGLRKVASGMTTLDEVLRVTMGYDA